MKKNDVLKVSHVNLSGKHTSRERKGTTYLTVTKETGEYNEPFNQIAIQTINGAGSNITSREDSLVWIQLENVTNRVQWSGTFQQLSEILLNAKIK